MIVRTYTSKDYQKYLTSQGTVTLTATTGSTAAAGSLGGKKLLLNYTNF